MKFKCKKRVLLHPIQSKLEQEGKIWEIKSSWAD